MGRYMRDIQTPVQFWVLAFPLLVITFVCARKMPSALLIMLLLAQIVALFMLFHLEFNPADYHGHPPW
jgi:hypothetical protein